MIKSKRITVADYLAQQIAISELSQKEIAERIGYDRPNIITMFKQGTTKLPINKVGPIAKALNVDPVYLLRLVLGEYMPETWEAIEQVMGKANMVSEHDLEILQHMRKKTKNFDIDLHDPRQEKMFTHSLEAFADKARADIESAVRAVKRKTA